jgi:hypothetical protein
VGLATGPAVVLAVGVMAAGLRRAAAPLGRADGAGVPADPEGEAVDVDEVA